MEAQKIELTPAQKSRLATLSQQTGEPVDVLLDNMLEELQTRMQVPKAGFKKALRSLELEGLDLTRVNGPDRPAIESD